MPVLVLFLSIILGIGSPALIAKAADEPAAEKAAPAPAETEDNKSPEPAQAPDSREYACKYYKVELPEDWKAIIKPTDQQGTINAIFATNNGGTVVTMIAGPSGGEEPKDIAALFAEQFKAPKPPVEKNGQYVFTFPIQNGNAQAIIAGSGQDFMLTTIAGSTRLAQNFLRKSVSSENYSALLPK